MSDARARQRPANRQLRRQKQAVPEQLSAWKASVFLAKGWRSKIPEQRKLRDEMETACDQVEQSVLQAGAGPNCHAVVSREKGLDPGKEFRAFQDALRAFEQADADARPGLVEGLRGAAQGYIDHYNNDHGPRQKRRRQNLRKKAICEATLSDLRKFDLRDQLKAIDDPPWNSATQMKAAALKTTLDIETVPPDTKGIEVLGGTHAFPAYWINKPNDNDGADKSFLFKPTVSDGTNGWEPGGDSTREAMSARTGDLVKGMTGLDIGIPETQIVAIGRDKMPDRPDGMVPNDEKCVGSVQQYKESVGDLRDQRMEDNDAIAPEACQKIILLDLLTLNCDRHAGNVLIKPNQGGPPDLIPIDHGQSFPPRNDRALGEISRTLGGTLSALLALPGSHQPFTDTMIDAINDIDPDALAAGLKIERATIEEAHPDAQGKLSDDSIEMSRRSAMFLKLVVANAPPLTPAAAQVAFGQNAEALLDTALDDAAFAVLATSIIKKAADNQDGLAEYMLLPPGQQKQIQETLLGNGWPSERGFLDTKWLLSNARLAMDLARGDVKNPQMMAELTSLLGQQELANQLRTSSLREVFLRRGALWRRPRLSRADLDAVDDIEMAFPATQINRNDEATVQLAAKDWEAFESLGGTLVLDDAIETLGLDARRAHDARTLFSEALQVLRNVQGQKEGPALVQNQNRDVLAVTADLAFLRQLAGGLSNNHAKRAEVGRFPGAPIDGSAQQKKALRTLRLQVLDALRDELVARLTVVRRRIEARLERETDEGRAEGLQLELERLKSDLAELASGNVDNAPVKVDDWEQNFP